MRLRSSLRLNGSAGPIESLIVSPQDQHRFSRDEEDVHRFAEVINGREYLIEVSSVGRNTWRAQIKRTPGGCAALMPFYGKTPDEAARHLSRWLALVHGQEQARV